MTRNMQKSKKQYGINHVVNKEKVRKRFQRRIRSILNTEFKTCYQIMAISSLAIPVVTQVYKFSIINWNVDEEN